MIDQLDAWIAAAAAFVWGPWLVWLLFGVHLFLTWRTGIVQRHLGLALRLSVTRDKGAPGDVSQFGALATALAATIGTGNIYGVAGAVLLGGPGAVLWMWLTGVFGIATKYSEALLSVKYRITDARGQMLGGPMMVLERGLNARWAGVLFATFTAIAAFGIGNMVQANAITDMVVTKKAVFHCVWSDGSIKLTLGLLMTIFTGMVIIGGIRSIARICEFLVPFMAFFYVVGCLIILAFSRQKLGSTLQLIVTSAFSGHAAVGGFAGAVLAQTMRAGVARGLFSNESGLGSAPIVAAAAQTRDPVRQALVSSTGTFWDTVVVCAMTGLVVVSSGDWTRAGATKSSLCDAAFHHLGAFGDFILIGGLLTFVFSTILGWSYYGEKAVEYLFGEKSTLPYRWAWVAAVFIGSIWKSAAVWDFADLMNGLMALPNLVSLLLLSSVIAAESRRYFAGPRD
jgi:AGCS family alanine or glycine:cation symporter